MDFKINFGPWETIFKGKMYDHEVEIVMNPEKYLLTLIYDIKDGKKVGVLVEGQKALVAKGEMGSFIQTLPKRCVGIIKTNGEKTNKMLFISFNPIYVDFKQEDFERKIDNAIKKSLDNIETIIELGKTSSLILTETSMAPETDYSPILGDPFMARSLLSGLKKTEQAIIEYNAKGLIITGGVSANTYITDSFQIVAGNYDIPLYLPLKKLSGDNSLMIASAGMINYWKGAETISWHELLVESNLKIGR